MAAITDHPGNDETRARTLLVSIAMSRATPITIHHRGTMTIDTTIGMMIAQARVGREEAVREAERSRAKEVRNITMAMMEPKILVPHSWVEPSEDVGRSLTRDMRFPANQDRGWS
jgi:hypothetical protein